MLVTIDVISSLISSFLNDINSCVTVVQDRLSNLSQSPFFSNAFCYSQGVNFAQ